MVGENIEFFQPELLIGTLECVTPPCGDNGFSADTNTQKQKHGKKARMAVYSIGCKSYLQRKKELGSV